MPPSARKPAEKRPADDEATEARHAKDAEICVRCWPNGWPTDDTRSANCEHGTWQR
jgi:hypothetical protein